ncbi:MAG: PilZ domain-containing protein [Treponema sp.]|jgi:hypothetical protein|nr:PilZ domain-containing protein [Treponema sp.]
MNFLQALYPLQTVQDFAWSRPGNNTSGGAGIVIFIIFIIIVIAVVIISNLRKGAAGGGKAMSAFALHRLTKNIGLNHDQAKMLGFVFKTDEVLDPYKSLITPELLDRHFRRAYRVIEQGSANEQEKQRKLAILFSTRNILENSSIGKISSTKQLKEDTILTLSTGREKLDVTIVYNKGEHIVIETPKNVLGTQIKIAKGTRLNIMFFTKSNKGFSFESRVSGYSTMHGHPVMLLAHSDNLRFLSQRRFRRRHAGIACFMFLVYVEGSGKKQRLVVNKRRMAGTIVDISVGGCSVKTTVPVQVGAKFKFEFTHEDENTVAALGQVLRSNKTGLSTIIHVKFLRVTQKSMNIINSFVYDFAN